ncbi:hypothetical protein COD67_14495 [Bacillus cereus]|nr:hypothetical protein COI89_05820 [Bacillus cereus]PGU65971.1 hypothetical protein COD67_14495 [Bacillus cereus]
MKKILSLKNYRNYGLSISLGRLAARLLTLAIYWYVLETTESVTALAVTGFVQSLPALFSMVVSKFADKYNAKVIMIFSELLRGSITILILLNIFTLNSIVIIIGLNILIEFAELLHTSSSTNIIPSIVNEKKIEQGVGTSNAIISISGLVGVAIGGIIYENYGAISLFLVATILFAGAIVFGLKIQIARSKVKEDAEDNGIKEINEESEISLRKTIKYIFTNSLLLRIVLVALIVNISFSAFDIVLTVHVHNTLNQGAQIYGIMSGSLMMGMIVGSILIGVITEKLEFSVSSLVLIGFVSCGIFLVLLGVIDVWILGILFIFGIGFFMAVIDSSIDSWLLRIIPEEVRGSVLNMLTALFSISLPIGNALFGFLLNKLNSSALFALMGIIVIIGIIIFQITGMKESVTKEILLSDTEKQN